MCEVELCLGSYRTVALLTHFYQRNPFVYSICVDRGLNLKKCIMLAYSLSVKYKKTLKALPLVV